MNSEASVSAELLLAVYKSMLLLGVPFLLAGDKMLARSRVRSAMLMFSATLPDRMVSELFESLSLVRDGRNSGLSTMDASLGNSKLD